MYIEDIDDNFKIMSHPVSGKMKIFDADNSIIKIYGLIKENNLFRRIPESIAQKISQSVYMLHTHTAGGRARFSTNSKYILLKVHYKDVGRMPHFALTGSSGFDLYEYDGKESIYINSFIPSYNIEDYMESIIELSDKHHRDLMINFPTYSSVESIEIGIEQDSYLCSAPSYYSERPVVFYGSSITQGGCSSRPGTTYPALLSSEFNFDYINLGFSGSAKGELSMAEYIGSLNPLFFVYDYDHNSPDANHLLSTHKDFFNQFRKLCPEVPVLIMSRPKYSLTDSEQDRLNIIKDTYLFALNNNDNNTYFISGPELMKYCKNEGTVDNCHPTDLGFFSMYKSISEFVNSTDLKNIFK